MGIPHSIDKIGITDNSKFNLMAEKAEVDPTASGNPIKLTKKSGNVPTTNKTDINVKEHIFS